MDAVNVTALMTSSVRASTAPMWKKNLPKVHGSTCIFAWFVLIPIAFFIARFFRDNLTQISSRLWFLTHRSLNVFASILLILGVLATTISHDWVWTGPTHKDPNSPLAMHTVFGLMAIILAWLQPFNALLRCGPDHNYRPAFNWVHRLFGVVGWAFAATSNMFACKFFFWDFQDATSAEVVCGLLIAAVLATFVVLEVIHYKSRYVNDDCLNAHWTWTAKVAVFISSTILILIFTTILCVLICVKVKP
ncbi:hypothetical protein L596_020424 [Steinernema carpocapsae]|uniref:Cytochrome b561 domain-containing protein n=1 Tax=Steinernema carpocapsae TaxID=34508 RepID=A0A4U5MTQ0_STECR|nr:hypothetical protein L596_020424 [Steinernema carpocapsae]